MSQAFWSLYDRYEIKIHENLQLKDRIKQLEDKLGVAVKALEDCADAGERDVLHIAQNALREIY
jgi:cell division septum initiation protein DivIVA